MCKASNLDLNLTTAQVHERFHSAADPMETRAARGYLKRGRWLTQTIWKQIVDLAMQR